MNNQLIETIARKFAEIVKASIDPELLYKAIIQDMVDTEHWAIDDIADRPGLITDAFKAVTGIDYIADTGYEYILDAALALAIANSYWVVNTAGNVKAIASILKANFAGNLPTSAVIDPVFNDAFKLVTGIEFDANNNDHNSLQECAYVALI